MEAEKCIPTSSDAAAKGEFTINDLDDDSLGIIFNKLPYRYRAGVEIVCKRWRDVIQANWWSYSKHLTIDKDTDIFPSLYDNTPEKNQHILQKTLERRGKYLEEITFTGVDSSNFEGGTIKRIIECCPRLKYLSTDMLELNSEDWLACSNLEGLSFQINIRNDGSGSDNELRQLLGRNKRLRQLKVEYDVCTTRTFDHLDPGQLEILHILISSYFEFTAELADKLAESLVELNYQPFYPPFCIILYLQHLSKLKNLRTLILNLVYVSEEVDTQFIVDIAQNCKKLEHITLYIFKPSNLNFIWLLFELPCLKSLVLILGEYEIPYEELDRLFRKAPNLKFFVLSSCIGCTYEEGNVKRCLICSEYRRRRVRNINSVARQNNEAFIITAA